jgi:hypothetical protein
MIRQSEVPGSSIRNAASWAGGSQPGAPTRPHAGMTHATSGGLTTLVQHLLGKTTGTAIRQDSAYLRKQIDQTRIRFMDSIAKGKPDREAAHDYISAVEQYRAALFAEFQPHI